MLIFNGQHIDLDEGSEIIDFLKYKTKCLNLKLKDQNYEWNKIEKKIIF